MQSKRHAGDDLRRVVAGMIMDVNVCSRIASQWQQGGLFGHLSADIIGGWCVNHLKQYGKPPGKTIETIYQDWAGRNGKEEVVVEQVGKVLQAANGSHARTGGEPSDYVLDLAAKVIDRSRLRQVIDLVENDLEGNRTKEAFDRLSSVSKVELGTGSVVKAAEDYGAWQRAFDMGLAQSLVPYPSRLARFFGDTLSRGNLVAFMGPDKVGKSMLLLDAAVRSLRSRCRVAYFDCGDMTEQDVMLRLGERAALKPRRAGRFRWPKAISREGKVEWEEREAKEGLSSGEAYKAFRKQCGDRDMFRLSCHPNSTLGVDDVSGTVQGWAREGWVADLVVLDYADILAPPRVTDPLEQIDLVWKRMRRLSQELHCLVLTATQSNAAAYKRQKGMLTRAHFSGRKTKLAHVNGMVGINQTPEEKSEGSVRLNWVVRRQGRYSERRTVKVVGCWDVACPVLRV